MLPALLAAAALRLAGSAEPPGAKVPPSAFVLPAELPMLRPDCAELLERADRLRALQLLLTSPGEPRDGALARAGTDDRIIRMAAWSGGAAGAAAITSGLWIVLQGTNKSGDAPLGLSLLLGGLTTATLSLILNESTPY